MGQSVLCGSESDCTGLPYIPQHQIDIVDGVFSIDGRWTVQELSVEVGLSYQTVSHILKKCFIKWKISSLWVPHRLTDVQKWHRYAMDLSTSTDAAMKVTHFCRVLLPLMRRGHEPNSLN
ncbi:hypothetical protein AVEN_5027-1 [Araneus ventricosus]|uniref:Uncharacterized protein n=1 Tax=Araneus ventricosus TaxID=182803 RepID=A0A4Y2JM68_ARAVE|nr:hypothetical protein AVEN_5027-1 [Araneus ventricosus]